MSTSLQRRQAVQGQRGRSPISPTPQYDAYGPQLGYLSENIHRLLTERECSIFDRGLADYHRRRNIRAFVECLSLVLNTNQKRQLLIPIRDSYIKPSDLVKFNQLVQDHGIATSLRRKKKDEKGKGNGVHRLEVKRDSSGDWGFSIRGGIEHGIGVFVSWVEPGSGAQKSGLQVGDQILKVNDLSFEDVSHYDAVSLLKNTKKASLWVLSRGRVPSSRMTHKVYRWMSPNGRSASPPPDPFDLQDQTSFGERNVMNEADERKVTVMVDEGKELGISIRGGAEHGLGIYISVVEEGSVAQNYGLKAGDQILEINGVSFQNIVHADAASVLRAQPCLVMRVKDVGKIPHSRITTYGKTEWKSPQGTMNKSPKKSQPVFKTGMGTQVMHGKQQTSSIQGRGLMNEVARSVLNDQELSTFDYYVSQYEQYGISVDDLVEALLKLLDTLEKLQLLSEVRALIRARDLQRFNELTVHKEITAKKGGSQSRSGTGFADRSASPASLSRTPNARDVSNDFILSPLPTSSPNMTLDEDLSSDEGRDKVPQKLIPQHPGMFHIPPPPSSGPSTLTSTPQGVMSLDPQSMLNETWDKHSNQSSLHRPPHSGGGVEETDSPGDLSAIEAKVRSETEAQLRAEFEEQQRSLREEQERFLAQEKEEKEMTLRREREKLETEMKEKEQRMQAEIEERLRREAEEKIQRELEEKERVLASKYATSGSQEVDPELTERIKEQTKLELEEKLYKEAEENMRQEYESKMVEERRKLQSEISQVKASSPTVSRDAENRLRRELEAKLKREYDEKLKSEKEQLKRQQQQEKKRREDDERVKREEEIARLEAEEQARIEMEERIRKEAEAAARAEYEVRLQRETEERAKLAEEVKARREAEERMEREREQRERELKSKKKEPLKQKPRHREPEPEEESESEDDAEESEDNDVPDSGPMHTGPATEEEKRMLEMNRKRREAEEREEKRREEAERKAANAAKLKQDQERQKKLEIQRKREENIRKREEERKQKEAEERLKREQQKSSSPKTSRSAASSYAKHKESSLVTSHTKPKADAQKKSTTNGGKAEPQKTKQQIIEDERHKAEEKLQKRMKRAQEKKETSEAMEPAKAAAPTPKPAGAGGKSYGGFEDLQGHILHITVTKIVKKLGIAIDGGANTKQKAVIIREISPEGCAAQTGQGLREGQQILSVAGESLYGKKHKDVVLTVKSGFEGPLGKTLELVVLDPQ